jgi:hypothetical protein
MRGRRECAGRALISELLSEAAAAGVIRNDVAPGELAIYCLHAIAAAVTLPSKTAVLRLVQVTLAGLRSDRRTEAGARKKRRRRKPA